MFHLPQGSSFPSLGDTTEYSKISLSTYKSTDAKILHNSQCNIPKPRINILMHVLIRKLFSPTHTSPKFLIKLGDDPHASMHSHKFWHDHLSHLSTTSST